MIAEDNQGMVHLRSSRSVQETLTRLKNAVQARGIAIVAEVDHSGDAARAGLTMRPTELLIFGNPKSGTPLMVACPTLALDLPLKALVWQDAEGQAWLSYNSPEYLQRRHGIPEDLIGNIAGIRTIAEEAVG
jgi:uncharacterized protein (DUF302 family)